MHTPPSPCQDWPPTPSVEDSGLGYNYYATTSVADEEGISILDAPTPAYGGSYRLDPLSRSISVASFGQNPTDLTFVQWADWAYHAHTLRSLRTGNNPVRECTQSTKRFILRHWHAKAEHLLD